VTVRQISGSFETAVDLLAAVAEAHPAREAFVERDRQLTFAGWQTAAEGVAAVMADAGVGPGDVVCLLLPPSADYAICYQAAMRLGAITSGINLRLGPAEIGSIVRRTEPRLMVGEAPDAEAAWGAASASGAGPSSARRLAILEPSDLRAAAAADPLPTGRRPAVRADDPVAIVWTSGTTGEPKGAVFDHRNLAAVAEGAGVLSAPGDRRLSPLPFAHVGYMTRVWDELVHVITTVIVAAPWKAGEALSLIETERVTVAQGVPAQWALMLSHCDADGTDFSSLRLAATGAAPAAPELIRAMRQRLGCPVIVRYASTEASLATGSRPGDPDEIVAATVGRPSGGVELEVVDDGGAPVPTGEVGTVRLRSGAVMRGYWHDPAQTAQVLSADRWLTTGDLGSLDAGGNLTLVGRRAEMYIRGGYNVYPAEVEAVLADHPLVDAAAVVGLPDPVLGEIGAAFVVTRIGDRDGPDLEQLQVWCRGRLADYKAPDRLVVVPELPLTAMNKVDKRALVALVSAPS
jgi:acyl-CoA synthetase (AMP-forming)/AMP-acid ligase II